jgi:hypothetical protein
VMVAATCKSSFIYIKNKKSLFILWMKFIKWTDGG